MKSILIIVPFDSIYPPMNGGMQRCFHFIHQLAKHFELTAIIHQEKESFVQCKKEFSAMSSVKIYSTNDVVVNDIFNLFPQKLKQALRSRWYQRELFKSADGSLIRYYPILKQLLKNQKFDVIVLENPDTLNAVKIIRRYNKNVKIIYNAHNVESNLAKAAFERKEITVRQLKSYEKAESEFYKKLNGVFTCSQEDKDALFEMNNGKLLIEVIPNGVNAPQSKHGSGVNQEVPQFILFCGSLWSIPNAEGLYWFCKKIWPFVVREIPSLKLLVVGTGKLPKKYSDVFETKNVDFIGAVDDVKPWYEKCAVSVAPLLTGSGTRLKILESMGMGVPVISTSIGAQGIEYTANENIVIADNENNFKKELIRIIRNKNHRLKISICASQLVRKKYDWNVIGQKLKDVLA